MSYVFWLAGGLIGCVAACILGNECINNCNFDTRVIEIKYNPIGYDGKNSDEEIDTDDTFFNDKMIRLEQGQDNEYYRDEVYLSD